MDDVSMLLEQLATIRIGDEERTRQLRRRYLKLYLEALRATAVAELPAPSRLARGRRSLGDIEEPRLMR